MLTDVSQAESDRLCAGIASGSIFQSAMTAARRRRKAGPRLMHFPIDAGAHSPRPRQFRASAVTRAIGGRARTRNSQTST